MSKRISKLLSMLLAAVMVLSMAMTGLAATITINNSSNGEVYNAYKIFDVTVTDDADPDTGIGYSYTIDSGSPWFSTVSDASGENGVFTMIQAGSSSTYYVTVNEGIGEDAVIAVFTNAVTFTVDETEGKVLYIGNAKLTADATAKADGTIATLTVSDPGYYFVTTTLGSVVMINTADDALEINEKNDVPTPEKYILDENNNEVTEENEDNVHTKTVTYVLYAKGVKGAVNLVIHDQMTVDEGITYEFDYSESSLKVELYNSSGVLLNTLSDGTHYTLLTADAVDENDRPTDNCDFEIVFNNTAEALFATCGEGSYVMVTINCSLDAGSATFADDEVEIENGEKLSYGNDGDSEWEVVDIYEYGFEIYKYTGSGDTKIALADAEFELADASDNVAYFIQNSYGEYVLEGWLAEGDEVPSEDYTTVIKTDSEGKAYIEGLAEGTYTLTEIKAPAGYNMLEDSITVTISAYETDPSQFTVTQDDTPLEGHIVSIENNAGTRLPGTGGMGTTLFYIIGAVLVLGAATLLITKKRLDKE